MVCCVGGSSEINEGGEVEMSNMNKKQIKRRNDKLRAKRKQDTQSKIFDDEELADGGEVVDKKPHEVNCQDEICDDIDITLTDEQLYRWYTKGR